MQLTDKEIKKIRKAFYNLNSYRDLLKLLNLSKNILYGESFIPIKYSQLRFYSSTTAYLSYTSFYINKKSGGFREIYAPNNQLKYIQHCLNLIFQVIYKVNSNAYGFVPGKSIKDNAEIHIGKNYVFNIDLKDFFPSISRDRILGRLNHPPFNLNKSKGRGNIAQILANLVTANGISISKDHDSKYFSEIKYFLPQGAPTSPVLSNIICEKLDFLLTGVAKRFNLSYSRYADDITFSSMHNVFQQDSPFINELYRVIENQGFRINKRKVRLQPRSVKQDVTGLVVNEKVNVSRRYIKQLRMWLHYWELYGYPKANAIFRNDYISDKGHVKKGDPELLNVLSGKLDYLKMIKGEDDSTYHKLRHRYETLMLYYSI